MATNCTLLDAHTQSICHNTPLNSFDSDAYTSLQETSLKQLRNASTWLLILGVADTLNLFGNTLAPLDCWSWVELFLPNADRMCLQIAVIKYFCFKKIRLEKTL